MFTLESEVVFNAGHSAACLHVMNFETFTLKHGKCLVISPPTIQSRQSPLTLNKFAPFESYLNRISGAGAQQIAN
jgi:hypothetical protein